MTTKGAAPVDVLAGALRVTCTDSPASGGVTTAIQAAVRELPAGTYWIVTDEARAAVADAIAELEKAHKIIAWALQTLPPKAKQRFCSRLIAAGLDGDGITRANEREAVMRRLTGEAHR